MSSDKKVQVLPPMPESKRKFVYNVRSFPNLCSAVSILKSPQLASVYRMETQMIDREPHRSVQLIRPIDTRVPANLLSQTSTAGNTLGKLADLRTSTGPGKLLYMAVRDIGNFRAQNQPQVCPNFGDFRVEGQKICPKVVRFWGFETDLGYFGPGPWTQNNLKINLNDKITGPLGFFCPTVPVPAKARGYGSRVVDGA